jgi:very-short-patch-repair endonuclease
MLAIELVKNGYKIIPQQKVGKYHVDFALPNEKLIIEVDGSIYHTNREKELAREASINYAIGLDWRIVHLPAESISNDVRKVIRLLKSGTQGTTNFDIV